MKPPPAPDAEFAQYAELRPKRPSWAGRLARRFQPAAEESDWAVHAVPEPAVDTSPTPSPPEPPVQSVVAAQDPPRASANGYDDEDLQQLSDLTEALEALSRRPLNELLDA